MKPLTQGCRSRRIGLEILFLNVSVLSRLKLEIQTSRYRTTRSRLQVNVNYNRLLNKFLASTVTANFEEKRRLKFCSREHFSC
jgi:hypothetical protein